MDLSDLDPETLQVEYNQLREELLFEKCKSEKLDQQIKQLERDYINQLNEIKTALEAEREKSNHLQSALHSKSKLDADKSDKENDRLSNLESENFKHIEKIKSLEAEIIDMQQNRVIYNTAQLNRTKRCQDKRTRE